MAVLWPLLASNSKYLDTTPVSISHNHRVDLLRKEPQVALGASSLSWCSSFLATSIGQLGLSLPSIASANWMMS